MWVCQKVLFTNVTTGGTGSNVWTYLFNGSSTRPSWISQTGNNIFKFTTPGRYNVTDYVTDKSGEVSQSSVIVTVNESLLVNGTKVVFPGNELTGIPTFSRDQVVTDLNLGPSGGVPPYTYEWYVALPGSTTFNPASCGTGATGPVTGTIVPCKYATNSTSPLGQYHFQLSITDNEQPPGSVTSSLEPWNLVAALQIVSFNANRTLISVGQNVTLSNVTVNGTGSNTYLTTELSGPNNGMVYRGSGHEYGFTKPGSMLIESGVAELPLRVENVNREELKKTCQSSGSIARNSTPYIISRFPFNFPFNICNTCLV